MKIILLHGLDGKEIFVNADNIAFFERYTYCDGQYQATNVATVFNSLTVRETPDEIVKEMTK